MFLYDFLLKYIKQLLFERFSFSLNKKSDKSQFDLDLPNQTDDDD